MPTVLHMDTVIRQQHKSRRVLLAGATGTIGRATSVALVALGHEVIAPVRQLAELPREVVQRVGHLDDPAFRARLVAEFGRADAIVSCIASRSGLPSDAEKVDRDMNLVLLGLTRKLGAAQFVLLSAICVQKPRLGFQHAKLEFEHALQNSGIDWTIIRPTAFFKSLSGQVARVTEGKPYLVFGDGTGTSCKPISDRDLATFIVATLDDPSARNAILPIGGPGPAITPLEQAEHLFRLLSREPRIRHVPLAVMDIIVAGISTAATVLPSLRPKAELARIGRYYATESMLVLNPDTGRYDCDATPSFGSDSLFDHYAELVRGEAITQLGAHSVFGVH